MNLRYPACSAEFGAEVSVGDLADCPRCGTTFEALRPPAAPASADDALRRAEIHAAEQRLRGDLAAADRQKVVDKLDRASAAVETFGKRASKTGWQLLVAVLVLPIFFYALFFLYGLFTS